MEVGGAGQTGTPLRVGKLKRKKTERRRDETKQY